MFRDETCDLRSRMRLHSVQIVNERLTETENILTERPKDNCVVTETVRFSKSHLKIS